MEPHVRFDEPQARDVERDEWPPAGGTPLLEPRFEALRAAYPHLPVLEFVRPTGWCSGPSLHPTFAPPFAVPKGHQLSLARLVAARAIAVLRTRSLATATALLRVVGDHARKAAPNGTVIVTIALSSLAAIGYAVTTQRVAPDPSTAPARQAQAPIATAAPDCPRGLKLPGCPAVVAMPARSAARGTEPLAAFPPPVPVATSGSTTSPALRAATGLKAANSSVVPPHPTVGDTLPAPGAPVRLEPSVISEVQARLIALGYEVGGVDGRLGRRTIRAVKAFQRDRGAPPDGVLSKSLVATIMAAQPKSLDMRTAASSAARG